MDALAGQRKRASSGTDCTPRALFPISATKWSID